MSVPQVNSRIISETTGRRDAADFHQPAHDTKHLLKRTRHQVFDHLRRRAFILGTHGQRRVVNIRHEINGQLLVRTHTEYDEGKEEHRRRNRTPDGQPVLPGRCMGLSRRSWNPVSYARGINPEALSHGTGTHSRERARAPRDRLCALYAGGADTGPGRIAGRRGLLILATPALRPRRPWPLPGQFVRRQGRPGIPWRLFEIVPTTTASPSSTVCWPRVITRESPGSTPDRISV